MGSDQFHRKQVISGGHFSKFRVGLDHIGFGCANRDELEGWMKRLEELGVVHGGIVDEDTDQAGAFEAPTASPEVLRHFPG